MSNTSPSILDLLETRRWKRAVFTSFTLSLTYFESYMLPRLRARGCASIDIYVDALGYRDSLMEQRSRHAGRDYSLHPVVVRSGIFHPKLIHLWAEEGEGDLLLVGSGNLTYAGHGGNLEVFEALRPEAHATAFSQAAEFFGELTTAEHVDMGEAQAPLRALRRRMASLAEKHPAGSDVQFIHSLSEPAVPQLARHLAGRAFDEFVIMSPYHNPDAAPIARLVDATRPRRVLISLDPKARTSPFPFELAETWSCDVSACEPDVTKARFSHAKWYEWRAADEAIAFTGSFNATTASLATRDNVECGVIRHLSTPSTHWREALRRPFEAQSFPRSNSRVRLIAEATLTGNFLRGRVIGFAPSQPRAWTFTIQNGEDAPPPPQSVHLAADGSFEVVLSAPVDAARENAIQIHMESGELSARGWVSLPDILKIAPQQRNLLSLLSRFEQGTDTAIGFASLLGILMDEIRTLNQEAPQPSSPKASTAASHKRSTDDRDWSTQPRSIVTDGPNESAYLAPRDRLLAALGSDRQDWGTWGHIGEILLGAGADAAKGAIRDPSSDGARGARPPRLERPSPETDDDAKELERETDILGVALAGFAKLMTQCRSTLRDRLERSLPDQRGAALITLVQFERMWLHVTLRAYVGHLNNVPGAIEWLGRWLHDNAHVGYDQPSLDHILPELAGCAAVLSAQVLDSPDTLYLAIVARRAPSPAARAVPYLEAAFNGAPDVALVLERGAEWFANQVCNELVNDAPDVALRALAIALERPTPRSQVARFLRERPSKVVPADWRPLPPKALDLLRMAIRPSGRRASYGVVSVRELHEGCPLCRRSLSHAPPGVDIRRPDPDLLSELKLSSVAACISCQAPLIERSALE